jgi:hypothetical protein
MLTPLRLSALALALIDRVAEGLILLILLDNFILLPLTAEAGSLNKTARLLLAPR